MNALRHGLRARTIVLPGEKQVDFDEIFDGLQDEYQPQCPSEQYLVYHAAIAQWKLVRAEASEASRCADTPDLAARHAIFGQNTLITGRLERAFFKAYKELQAIKSARVKQPASSYQKEKEKEKEKDKTPANLVVAWVNPETGAKDVFHRTVDGKSTNYRNGQPLSSDPDS